MSNLRRFVLDRAILIIFCLVMIIVNIFLKLEILFFLSIVALLITVFFPGNEMILLMLDRRKAPITKKLKAVDYMSGMRVIIARQESWFIWWCFEDENGKLLALLDPTMICKKSLTERKEQLKDKQFVVQYYKKSKLIVSMEEVI